MKIALIGYGKMGKMIEQIAIQRGHMIVAKIDPQAPEATGTDITPQTLGDADVCIDFTHPAALVENVRKIAGVGKPVVVGTTGWYKQLSEVQTIVAQQNIGFIYASNFSLGMNIFTRLADYAAAFIDKCPQYDVAGLELHHNKKADSPSGTAKALAETLKKNIARKKVIVYDMVDRQIKQEELHFASVRIGNIPGTHTLIFDSAADTIELTHTARSREGFALGAVMAAEWLPGKKGFYTIDDFMNNLLEGF
ncbi:4-hydroxy-tetrahydrodipicolinate reductase [Candidatus Woesearchaeota archaeon]|nr:4-hydroxy-tetrahydrodipicolinate reductase [Candidatus Woesearchaeota archaeon]